MNGNSKTTRHKELIIEGYIKLIEILLSITIPNDIKIVIYSFYEYYCDTWNVQLSHSNIVHNETMIGGKNIIIKTYYTTFYGAFGTKIIKKGNYYHWKIRFIDKLQQYSYMGIIKNDKDIISSLRIFLK